MRKLLLLVLFCAPVLATVHPKFRTPVYATLLMGAVILVLSLWLPLELLAKITSGIMLVNFATVNASLVRLKLRPTTVPEEDLVRYPIWVPILGCTLCTAFLVLQYFASPT